MTKKRTALGVGLALLLTTSLAVTTTAQILDDENAELEYCRSVAELAESVDSLAALDASSTVEELESAVDSVRDSGSAVREDLRAVLEAQIDEIGTAVEGLEEYRDSIEDDATVEEALRGAGPAVAEVARAYASAGSVDCQAVLAESAAQAAMEEGE